MCVSTSAHPALQNSELQTADSTMVVCYRALLVWTLILLLLPVRLLPFLLATAAAASDLSWYYGVGPMGIWKGLQMRRKSNDL